MVAPAEESQPEPQLLNDADLEKKVSISLTETDTMFILQIPCESQGMHACMHAVVGPRNPNAWHCLATYAAAGRACMRCMHGAPCAGDALCMPAPPLALEGLASQPASLNVARRRDCAH